MDRKYFDGVIAAIEVQKFTEVDLLNIWDFTAELLYIYPKINGLESNNNRNDLNHIYVCHIRDGIVLAAQRLVINDIESKMEALVMGSFQINTDQVMYDYIYPTR